MSGQPIRIALVMELADHFDREIVRGVVQYAKGASWQLYGHGWMFSAIDDLPHWNGDGVIGRIESPEAADLLASLSVPVVDVAGAYVDHGFLSVRNDDRETGRVVGNHLVSRGVRSFCFFGVRGVDWSIQREQGFLETIEKVPGAAVARSFTRPLAWWKTPGAGPEITEYVRNLPEPVGALACNDATALKVLEACRLVGRPVPESLAVVGVDNEDIMCDLATPSLSSVELKLDRIGYRAAARLAAAVAGEGNTEATMLPPHRLMERVSSRVFATKDPIVCRGLEMIYSRIADGLTTADLVDQLPIGRRSLEMRFRRETGKTVHSTIREARLRRACDLLRDTDRKIAAVAEDSGFHSIQRFFEVFKGALGVTPGDYRRGLETNELR